MTQMARVGGILLAVLAVLVLPGGSASGSAGELDLSFGQGGVHYPEAGFSYSAEIAVEPDDGLVLVTDRGEPCYGYLAGCWARSQLLRVASDGNSSRVLATLHDVFFSQVAVQPDGRIVVAGGEIVQPEDPELDPEVHLYVTRFEPDGTLDQGFGEGGVFRAAAGRASVLAVSPSGKVFVGGLSGLFRLSPSGEQEGFLQASVSAMALDSSGRPIVIDSTGNAQQWTVRRLTSEMTADPAFVGPSGPGWGTHIAVGADGKPVLLGWDTSFHSDFVARLTPTGAFDSTFGQGGRRFLGEWPNGPLGQTFRATSMALSQGNRVVLAGQGPVGEDGTLSPGPSFGSPLARLSPDGSADRGFGKRGFSPDRISVSGSSPHGSPTGELALQSDGGIVATVPRVMPSPIVLARFLGKDPRRCGGRKATIVGSRVSETIKGTKRRDIIAGLGGKDLIWGGGGPDVICGNAGADTLGGGKGGDRLFGGSGRDLLKGGPAEDLVKQGAD